MQNWAKVRKRLKVKGSRGISGDYIALNQQVFTHFTTPWIFVHCKHLFLMETTTEESCDGKDLRKVHAMLNNFISVMYARWYHWKCGYKQLEVATINQLRAPITTFIFCYYVTDVLSRNDEDLGKPCAVIEPHKILAPTRTWTRALDSSFHTGPRSDLNPGAGFIIPHWLLLGLEPGRWIHHSTLVTTNIQSLHTGLWPTKLSSTESRLAQYIINSPWSGMVRSMHTNALKYRLWQNKTRLTLFFHVEK